MTSKEEHMTDVVEIIKKAIFNSWKDGLAADAYLDAYARAALAALNEAGYVVEKGWQPIETAPRDGTPILGGFWSIRWADSHRVGQVVKCWYQPEFDAFISSARVMTLAPGLTFDDGKTEQVHSPVIEPVTQWMALHPYMLSAAQPAPKVTP